MKLIDQYSGLYKNWQLYIKAYGGIRSLLTSPYLHFALILTFVCKPIWDNHHSSWVWFDLCNSVLPNILGFTLGGYAILLAFGNSKFMDLLAGKDSEEEESPFMVINGTFIHFILLQASALFFSIFSLAWDFRTGKLAFIGFFLFLYALSVSVAAAFAVLRLANWYDIFIEKERKQEK